MAGLTQEGFTPLSFEEIKDNISGRLSAFSPGIDLSTESPDGQLVEIFSFELSQAWAELNKVYNSYNPDVAEGAALRNIGLITGLPFGAATRSQANVRLLGTAGTVVPAGSLVADSDGNEFATIYDGVIQALPLYTTVQAIAVVSGNINTDMGAINTVVTQVSGWTGVDQPYSGRVGGPAQTEIEYRNLRNRTVLRNSSPTTERLRANIVEKLGIDQVRITNNDELSQSHADGTPPNHIHIVIGETDLALTNAEIARVIYDYKGLGTLTYGSTTETVEDTQNAYHNVSFTKAGVVNIHIKLEVDFLDDDYAGAEEGIKADLVSYINSLKAGEDVVWSRLFGIITPYSKADVTLLEIGKVLNGVPDTPSAGNILIGYDEYTALDVSFIDFSRA
jgi:uncharacterized phage protein gp47/JayE